MIDFLIHGNIPNTLYSNMSTFRDTNRSFELDRGLLKTMTNCKFNVGHSNPQDGKISRKFVEEMNFDIKNIGRSSTRDKSPIKLPNSPAIMASGISTIFLPENPHDLCKRLKLLLQEKQAGNNSDIINKEFIAIVDKKLEYKCIFKKQHEGFLNNCNVFHTTKNYVLILI